ncbi:MAG: thioredoxin [Bacteroidales bacterium]|nr:thioredoxin [Bacteroidales bacterium]
MQTALIITGIVIAIFVFLTLRAKAKMKSIPLVDDHEKILTLTDKNFQHQTSNKVVLVDFWAAWCGPCRVMAPVLNEIAGELKGNQYIGKVNVEQYQSLAGKFKVRGIPTLVLFKNGKEVNRFVGVKSKEFLVKQIQSA